MSIRPAPDRYGFVDYLELELGYQRHVYASNLSRKKEYRFGVLMPRTYLNSEHWEAPFRGAEIVVH